MKTIKTTIAQSGTALYIKALILGTIAGCISLALLLCLTSLALILTGSIPHKLLSIITIILCSLSSFVSGYVSGNTAKEKGLILGATSGLIIFITVLVSGLVWGDGNFTYLTLIKLIFFLIFGILGGIKAVNKKDRIHIK